jgi:hypothetical protein
VPDELVNWSSEWPDYVAKDYTTNIVLSQPIWADPKECSEIKNFNELDKNVDRRSHEGKYELDNKTGRPLNPKGRTGLSGRGILGKWGPNHAADPIVTR